MGQDAGVGLLQDGIDERCYVAHIHFAIGIDIAHLIGERGIAKDTIDEGSYIAHIHYAIAIHIARGGFGFALVGIIDGKIVDV